MPELEYALCAIDLDETLLGPDHHISPRNARAIRAVRELGVVVIIASGRMHEATLRYAQELDLDGPIISYNGALIKVPNTGEEWMHDRVPSTVAQEVMEYCAERKLQLNFYYNGLVHTAEDTAWLQLYHTRTGSPYIVESQMLQTMSGIEPTKLLIVDTPEYTNSLLPVLRDRYEGVLYVTKTTDEYLELMPLNANKGAALEYAANRLGTSAARTIAIGDSYNDIPMVKWAGLGLAVGNAKPELLAVANRTIARSDEDGVGQVLEELFRLGR